MVDLRMSHSTCSAAVNRLMRLGWVYDAGVRTKTRAGRAAIVWMPQDPPIPLREAMPTRMELARRIKRTISLIERGSTDGISLEEITSILKGNTK
jgi:predicted transcriptional regulator